MYTPLLRMDSLENKKEPTKFGLHPRNKHRQSYDFELLVKNHPPLKPFISINKYGNESINFFDNQAVLALNKALLITHYGIKEWDIPKGYLCPPIPGRANYIHQVADLLAHSNNGKVPTGKNIHCLDIGVGANCIYPIIGNSEYHWSFVGSDINETAIKNSNAILKANSNLNRFVSCRFQKDSSKIFAGIIENQEYFDLTICNPPFHASEKEALGGTTRKLRNLKGKQDVKPQLNFGGQAPELWTDGGERKFVIRMIKQSKAFKKQCFWFTTLVSKESNLKAIYSVLKQVNATDVTTIPMTHGNKKSRVVAWTFLTETERQNWARKFWR